MVWGYKEVDSSVTKRYSSRKQSSAAVEGRGSSSPNWWPFVPSAWVEKGHKSLSKVWFKLKCHFKSLKGCFFLTEGIYGCYTAAVKLIWKPGSRMDSQIVQHLGKHYINANELTFRHALLPRQNPVTTESKKSQAYVVWEVSFRSHTHSQFPLE